MHVTVEVGKAKQPIEDSVFILHSVFIGAPRRNLLVSVIKGHPGVVLRLARVLHDFSDVKGFGIVVRLLSWVQARYVLHCGRGDR